MQCRVHGYLMTLIMLTKPIFLDSHNQMIIPYVKGRKANMLIRQVVFKFFLISSVRMIQTRCSNDTVVARAETGKAFAARTMNCSESSYALFLLLFSKHIFKSTTIFLNPFTNKLNNSCGIAANSN